MENYYQTLGISAKATEREIKTAFKRLAVKYHPDKNPGNKQAEEEFKKLNAAYQVLSNPDLKAAYDLRLMNRNYEKKFHHSDDITQKPHRDPRYRGRGASQNSHVFTRQNRARYSKAEDQKKGLTWALGIVGSIVVVFLVVIGINSYLSYLEKEAFREERERLRGKIKEGMLADEFETLLEEIDENLKGREGYNAEMEEFRDEVFDALKSRAQEEFNNKSYQGALTLFSLWQKLDNDEEVFLNTRIAEIYKHLGSFDLAKQKLYQLIAKDRSAVFAYAELGQISAKFQEDYPTALLFYDTASMLILEGYQSEFGEAYGIMLDPDRLPDLQYDVYLEKGRLNDQLGNYEKARVACNWAVFLRDNRPDAYEVKANSEMMLGNREIACQDLQKALSLGSKTAEEKIRNNCN